MVDAMTITIGSITCDHATYDEARGAASTASAVLRSVWSISSLRALRWRAPRATLPRPQQFVPTAAPDRELAA